MTETRIVGREAELEAIRAFVGAADQGPQALGLAGEAGAGKTTLWRAGVAAARSAHLEVLESHPAEAEAALSFTVLGDLLEDVADTVLPALPEPQRRALEIALLHTAPLGDPPDERAVAVGFLGAVRHLALEGPVIAAIDDVQWVDASSEAVIAYAARRLTTEPVRFLFTERAERPREAALGFERALPGRFERVLVGPLSLGATHRLLQDRLGVTFPRPTLRRLHGDARGNPFFALELGRALAARDAPLSPGDPLPVPRELRTLLRERLAALPPETRKALLVAATAAQPTSTLVRAITDGGVDDPLYAAVAAGLIEIEGEIVRFTHPLLAAAARETDEIARRDVHRRLANVVTDSVQRARHLAFAADGVDECVARALDAAARTARARGAPEAAAELAQQAAKRTPPTDFDGALRRSLDAAWYTFAAGDTGRARALLEETLTGAPPGARRAEVLARLARLGIYEGHRPETLELFREALREAGVDAALQAEIHEGIAWCLLLMRRDLPTAAKHACTAVALADKAGDPIELADALAVQAQCEFLMGGGLPSAAMERALRLGAHTRELRVLRQPTIHSALLLFCADDFAEARARIEVARESAAVRGDESARPWILMRLSQLELLAGDWGRARELSAEGYELAVQAGQRTTEAGLLATSALVAAHAGQVEEARAYGRESLEVAERLGAGVARRTALWALGLLELSLDTPAETERLLSPLWDETKRNGVVEPGESRFVSDLIEALVALRRLDEADEIIRDLHERAEPLGRISALATAARGRGLVAAAERRTESALEALEHAAALSARAPIPFEHARTLLVRGSIQRRAKRKRDARTSLNEALEIFTKLGATLWEEKVRVELASIGGRAPSRGELTPTEERVAALVAEGRTNREAAAALFVTDRTIEFHLSRIYAKLGVRSRAELARRL